MPGPDGRLVSWQATRWPPARSRRRQDAAPELPDRNRPPSAAGLVNKTPLLSVLVGMSTIPNAIRDELPRDADAAVRVLYSRHAGSLHAYAAAVLP